MANTTANPRLKQALIAALAPQGAFAQSFAFELQAALPLLTPDAARASAADMLARRQASLKAEPPDAPLEKPKPGLVEGKMEELVESFVQPRKGSTPNKADALIHIFTNIDAQRALHIALANYVYAPNGRLEKSLAENIKREDPALSDAEAKQAATDYIATRRARAHGVVEALRPGGPVEQQAISLAEKLRREGERPAAMQAAAPTLLTAAYAGTPRPAAKMKYSPPPVVDYVKERKKAVTITAFATAAVLGGLLLASAIPATLTAAAWVGLTAAAGIGLYTSVHKERREKPHHGAGARVHSAAAREKQPLIEKTVSPAETRDGWVERTAAPERQQEAIGR